MRELNCAQLQYDPNTVAISSEEAGVKVRDVRKALEAYDVHYLMRCLETDRNTSYAFEAKPDEENRQESRPDFLYRELKTNHLIAVEHTRLYESEKARERDVFIVRNKYDDGIIPVPINFPNAEDLADRITEVIRDKARKKQFGEYPKAEHVLLIRNKWNEVRPERFHQSGDLITVQPSSDFDHCYILHLGGVVLEIF